MVPQERSLSSWSSSQTYGGKFRDGTPGAFIYLDISIWRFEDAVAAAQSAVGRRNPFHQKALGALMALFSCPFYGGRVGQLRLAGALLSRYSYPNTFATLACRKADGDSPLRQKESTMSVSTTRKHARSAETTFGFGDGGSSDANLFGVDHAADPVALNDFSASAQHAVHVLLEEGMVGGGIDANKAWLIQHLLQAVQAATDSVLAGR
jgi:hypothetical protein